MLSHAQASDECIAEAQRIGRLLARQLMNKVFMFDLTPDDIASEVEAAMEDARRTFLQGGADKSDTKAIMSVIKIALAEEGARLSLLSTFETGHA